MVDRPAGNHGIHQEIHRRLVQLATYIFHAFPTFYRIFYPHHLRLPAEETNSTCSAPLPSDYIRVIHLRLIAMDAKEKAQVRTRPSNHTIPRN